jgi:hypothetical protein
MCGTAVAFLDVFRRLRESRSCRYSHISSVLKVDPLIDVLGKDLELTPPLANGTANTNGDKRAPSKTKIDGIPWTRCRNAVMVISRMPLEPLPQQRKNEIFHKLLKLDREIVHGIVKLPLQKSERLDFLVIIRRALIRYGNTVTKTVIEVF